MIVSRGGAEDAEILYQSSALPAPQRDNKYVLMKGIKLYCLIFQITTHDSAL